MKPQPPTIRWSSLLTMRNVVDQGAGCPASASSSDLDATNAGGMEPGSARSSSPSGTREAASDSSSGLESSSSENVILRGLTFELSGRRRQDARARAAMMHHVPQAGAWWPAVGAPLERVVRHRAGAVGPRASTPAVDSGALRRRGTAYEVRLALGQGASMDRPQAGHAHEPKCGYCKPTKAKVGEPR